MIDAADVPLQQFPVDVFAVGAPGGFRIVGDR
jgi:hypothetical protein